MKDNTVLDKLAESLTAQTTDLIPFLPYLLQDLWELGSDPATIAALLSRENLKLPEKATVLDLACGKGAVSVRLASELGFQITGIDIISDFIEEAKKYAEKFGVQELCHFEVLDINEYLKHADRFDVVVFGAVGTVLGGHKDTLKKLCLATKEGGYIIIDDAFLKSAETALKYQTDCLTYSQWQEIFEEMSLQIIGEIFTETFDIDSLNDENNEKIAKRVGELKSLYPDKAKMFDGYLENQKNESADLSDSLTGVTWLLKK